MFADRSYVEDIGSVRQVRNMRSYVLDNWRRHLDDTCAYTLFEGRLDPYASGLAGASRSGSKATQRSPSRKSVEPTAITSHEEAS